MKSTPASLARFLLVGALALAACTSPPLGTATNTYSADQAGKRSELVGDRDLMAKFVLLDIKSEPRDGRLRIQFDLKNTTPADLPIEWAIEWRDRSGFTIDTNPHWRPVIVPGQGLQSIQATAPTSDAVVWSLQVRKPTPIR